MLWPRLNEARLTVPRLTEARLGGMLTRESTEAQLGSERVELELSSRCPVVVMSVPPGEFYAPG